MSEIIIRIMGETDIVDVTMQPDATATSPLLDGHDEADRINLLGHWMDQGRGTALAEDAQHFAAMTIIAAHLSRSSLCINRLAMVLILFC